MRAALTLFLVLISTGPSLRSQSGPTPSALGLEDHRLGSGDLIQISVFGVEDFKYDVRIGSSGTVTLPYLGAVLAKGKTALQLADELQESMEGTLFRNPQVSVVVLEYRSNPVTVMGAVGRPGSFQIAGGELKLIDALAQAGGVSEAADEYVVIQRSHEGEEQEPETIKINLDDLFTRGIVSLNIPLRAGDIVNIPAKPNENKIYYVIGEVVNPGVFTLPNEHNLFLTQAVAAAGGPLKTAKAKNGILVRYDEDGKRQEIAVNFKEMLEGKKKDFLVQERDVIFIPGSNIKTIGYGLLGVIPGVASQTATSGVVR